MTDDRQISGSARGYNLDFVDWQNEWERIVDEAPELYYPDEAVDESDTDAWKEQLKTLKKMKMGKSGQTCSICVAYFQIADKIYKLGCGHIFHCDCFEPWVKRNDSCPNCRSKLTL
jgi:hypothetical protein